MLNNLVDIDEALRLAIRMRSSEDVVSEHVMDRVPFIFSEDWSRYRRWRQQLGISIGVDPCNISLIGSACVGVSLNPRKAFSRFDEMSDIDVAIISDFHFDIAWRALRGFRLADARNNKERASIINHQKRHIYYGCIAADKILRILPFFKKWQIAISNMQGEFPTEGRDIKCRIYKDFDSLRSYQQIGVKSLQASLLADEQL